MPSFLKKDGKRVTIIAVEVYPSIIYIRIPRNMVYWDFQ